MMLRNTMHSLVGAGALIAGLAFPPAHAAMPTPEDAARACTQIRTRGAPTLVKAMLAFRAKLPRVPEAEAKGFALPDAGPPADPVSTRPLYLIWLMQTQLDSAVESLGRMPAVDDPVQRARMQADRANTAGGHLVLVMSALAYAAALRQPGTGAPALWNTEQVRARTNELRAISVELHLLVSCILNPPG